jgi:hypothetical protein
MMFNRIIGPNGRNSTASHGRARNRNDRSVCSVVPAETAIRRRMNERISSKTARVGTQFTTTVVTPMFRATRGLIKKGEEAEVDSGTQFDMMLNHSVSMSAFR